LSPYADGVRHSYSSLEEITEAVQVAAGGAGSTVFIGIDGAGGSGKSTLAARFAEDLSIPTVVRIDDFADWSDDSNWTMSTFAERVLQPLIDGLTSKHQRYDWPTDSFGEWFEITPGGIVIVEGVSALRNDLRKYWTVPIWVDCPRELRLERGIARDGESMRSQWEDLWMPGEDAYMERERPWEHARFTFDGSGGSDQGRT
jgi:uridine kinase